MSNILFPTDTTGVTPASGDIILIADVSDSNNPKDCTLAELPISTATQTALDAKASLSGDTFTGDISVPDEAYGVGWNGSTEVPTKNAIYDKIETLSTGSVATDTIWDAKGDLAVGTGANTASRLAVGANGQVLTADSAEATGVKWATVSGTGDVTSASTITDNAIVRGDGGAKGVQSSLVSIDDSGNISTPGYEEFANMSTPSNPASGNVRIYGKNTASGVTRLNMLTSTGAELAFFRDSVTTIRNETGSSLTKGQMVYVNGANGTTPTVALAKADSASTSRNVGMVLSATIGNNAYGTIQIAGEISGVDTSGFTQGDALYLSASTAGAITNVAPTSPNLVMFIGHAINSSASGKIHLIIDPTIVNDVNISTTDITSNDATTSKHGFMPKLSAASGTGVPAFTTSPTFTTPILGTPTSGILTNCTGLPVAGITASTSTALGVGSIELGHATDTSIVREAAGIISVENEIINGYNTTATAAGTTALTRASAKKQVFTGTTTQTVTLPTTGIILGQQYVISNKSTGKVTVQSSGANTVYILGTGNIVTFTAQQATPTTAAHWEYTLIDGIDNDKDTTATANAATIDLMFRKNTITNNSAATLTITLPTAGAVDGMMRIVRVLDFSAVAQTITWVNTENSSVTVPTPSNGSTTLPKTAGFQFNGATSLWRCIASA